jgi:hypothetical protein
MASWSSTINMAIPSVMVCDQPGLGAFGRAQSRDPFAQDQL